MNKSYIYGIEETHRERGHPPEKVKVRYESFEEREEWMKKYEEELKRRRDVKTKDVPDYYVDKKRIVKKD